MKFIAFVLTSFVTVMLITSSLISVNAFAQGDGACVDCHTEQTSKWQQSDHAKAMAIADETTVKANFNKQTSEHYGQKAYFYKSKGKFFVDISYDDKVETLAIAYTFGHYPLQQYLVETKKGSFQVLPFAWDSRTIEEGGQRWYHNYANEEIKPEDRLHWRQPLQNWNGMCADCHSDGLERNYDAKNNSFASEFSNINVGCVSCHGDKDEHSEQATQDKAKPKSNHSSNSSTASSGMWKRKFGEDTAKWVGEKRDNSFMDNCFSCHSLRAPLTDGIKPNSHFLDQFTPQLLQAPAYHVDGQIKDEVYVYGSFLQSKMFAKGVNCIDCHDQHTMKVKIPGNGLCLQCHASEVFDKPEHHNHENGSDGAQCVNCHMPENRYMGVDDRRDHSFKIPRPELSEQYSSPNACTTCHEGKDNQWALGFMQSWKIKPRSNSQTQQDFFTLKSGQPLPVDAHLAIVGDENIDVISRATALQMLVFSTQEISADTLKPYLHHQQELLRLAAASVGTLINPGFRAQALSHLLNDPRKAIRVAAARTLVDVYIPQADLASFNKAFKELTVSLEQSGWRGEGRLNQGLLEIDKSNYSSAEKHFKEAIRVEPYFDAAYSNLAEFYRMQNKPAQVISVYNSGINKVPASALLHYGYGLHLIRNQQLGKAIPLFKKSMLLDPSNAQYAYVYALSIDGTGDTKQAIEVLKSIIGNYSQNQQLVELGLSFAQKLQDKASFDYFMGLRGTY
ncbi:MAG: multiheme c-type cytochrome [Thalassotalea sp.]|nr:multiheme c-type cytochrome [Thalassotalea sp.]